MEPERALIGSVNTRQCLWFATRDLHEAFNDLLLAPRS